MIILILNILEWYMADRGESSDLGPLRVFSYITVRAGSAFLVSFAISLIFGPGVIHRLRELKIGQVIRKAKKADAISLDAMHGAKAGTPTMGGLLIIFAVCISAILFCRLDSMSFLVLMAMSLGFGAIGFWDDYSTIAQNSHIGLSPRGKLIAQAALGLLMGLALWLGDWPVRYNQTDSTGYAYLLFPLFKNLYPYIGILFVGWVMFLMMASSNAVNLTDGLDGLAIGTTAVAVSAFTFIAYMASRFDTAAYLLIPYVPDAGEIVVFGAATIGASMGFLWFNSHPAQVFMGDTGSMMLGGVVGSMAILLKQELLLLVIGGMFVAETASVILQVGSYKLRKKRIFLMAPLHHHYEKKGIHESKIIIRFWLVSIILALIGLASLKLR